MLLTTPENRRWRRWAWWMLFLLIGSYFWYATNQYPHGGTLAGLIYGTLGLVIILILMFYGIRKRAYRSRLGSVQTWLHLHIYLGLLVLLIILLHSGFRFHDKIAISALVLLALAVLSGLVGAILYTTVPPLLTDAESNLTAREMSDQINQLSQSMARQASGKSQVFQRIYRRLARAEQPGIFAGWRLTLGSYASKRSERKANSSAQSSLGQVPADEQPDLNQLFVLARQMKEVNDRMIIQQRYQNLLIAWLYLHLPLSFAMMVAVGAHITAFLYYW